MKLEGNVKWFNRKKGYGFVDGDDGKSYFVHYTALAEGVELKDNDRVTFEAVTTDKGEQAQSVVVVEELE